MPNDTAPVLITNIDKPMTDAQIAEGIRREYKAMLDMGAVAVKAYGCTVDHGLNIGAFIWAKMKLVPKGQREQVLITFLREYDLPIKIRQAQNLMRLHTKPEEVKDLRANGVNSIRGLLKGIAKPRPTKDEAKTQRVAFTDPPPTPQKPPSSQDDSRYGDFDPYPDGTCPVDMVCHYPDCYEPYFFKYDDGDLRCKEHERPIEAPLNENHASPSHADNGGDRNTIFWCNGCDTQFVGSYYTTDSCPNCGYGKDHLDHTGTQNHARPGAASSSEPPIPAGEDTDTHAVGTGAGSLTNDAVSPSEESTGAVGDRRSQIATPVDAARADSRPGATPDPPPAKGGAVSGSVGGKGKRKSKHEAEPTKPRKSDFDRLLDELARTIISMSNNFNIDTSNTIIVRASEIIEELRRWAPSSAAVEIPDWLDENLWWKFIVLRNRDTKHLTAFAAGLILDELRQAKDEGHDPNALLKKSLASGWRSVWKPKQTKTNGSHFGENSPANDARIFDAIFGQDGSADSA